MYIIVIVRTEAVKGRKQFTIYPITVRQGSSSEECVINTKIQSIYFFTIRYTVLGQPTEGRMEGGVQRPGL